MIKVSLSHLRFLVDDVSVESAFYKDVLGLKQIVDVPDVYAEFDTGGSRLAFYSAELMQGVTNATIGKPGGDVVLCLRVDDVNAATEAVLARGAKLLREPHDQTAWYQRVAHIADPAGRTIELWSPLAAPSKSA
ncbi:MAG TPA: VOC family protein [Casimicrobiaceae bacterium]|nr:VOC family protein [Casimicrobiaceae bacterium]